MRGLTIALAAAWLTLGCVASQGANPTFGCETDADCPGARCERGFCIGGSSDAGMDATVLDAGMDAGAATGCPAAQVCFDGQAAERGVGACRDGCMLDIGNGVECLGQRLPAAETCNGIDDDCDGDMDEQIPLDDETNCGGCGLSCDTGVICCGSQTGGAAECANLASDVEHCGDCTTSCASGEGCCGVDGCTPLDTVDNCGACGRACTAGQSCCDGACVNTDVSEEHCGGCEGDGGAEVCTGGDSCCGGNCLPPADIACTMCTPECTGSDSCCDGQCVDTQTDVDNCGSCGAAPLGAGMRCCEGSPTPIDDNGCEACGVSCGDGSRCCEGQCTPIDALGCEACGQPCMGGESCCNGECVDTTRDDRYCGGCDLACNGEQDCSVSQCCPTGWQVCAGQCRNLQDDDDHCGECNRSCRFLIIPTSCNAGSC